MMFHRRLCVSKRDGKAEAVALPGRDPRNAFGNHSRHLARGLRHLQAVEKAIVVVSVWIRALNRFLNLALRPSINKVWDRAVTKSTGLSALGNHGAKFILFDNTEFNGCSHHQRVSRLKHQHAFSRYAAHLKQALMWRHAVMQSRVTDSPIKGSIWVGQRFDVLARPRKSFDVAAIIQVANRWIKSRIAKIVGVALAGTDGKHRAFGIDAQLLKGVSVKVHCSHLGFFGILA